MGIIYYARNEKTKRAFELNKGPWHLIADFDENKKQYFINTIDCYLLASRIQNIFPSEKSAQDIEYYNKIAKSLAELGDELRLVNDHEGWAIPTDGFLIVGDRFYKE